MPPHSAGRSVEGSAALVLKRGLPIISNSGGRKAEQGMLSDHPVSGNLPVIAIRTVYLPKSGGQLAGRHSRWSRGMVPQKPHPHRVRPHPVLSMLALFGDQNRGNLNLHPLSNLGRAALSTFLRKQPYPTTKNTWPLLPSRSDTIVAVVKTPQIFLQPRHQVSSRRRLSTQAFRGIFV